MLSGTSSGMSGMSGISRYSAKQQLIMGALSVWSVNLEEIEMGKELGKGAFGKVSRGGQGSCLPRDIAWPPSLTHLPPASSRPRRSLLGGGKRPPWRSSA